MSGSIDLGPTINARLPFKSPAFAGAALTGVVALPMAAGMTLSWRAAQRTDSVATAAGLLLMGWIVVELAVIRSFSWLHPTYFIIGGAIAAAGLRGSPPTSKWAIPITYEVLVDSVVPLSSLALAL